MSLKFYNNLVQTSETHAIFGLVAAGVIPALLALYLLATSGWNLLPAMDSYDAKRVLEVIIIGFSLLFGLLYRPVRSRAVLIIGLIPWPVQLAIALVFTFGLISALASGNVFYGLTEVSLYFCLFALIFFTAASAQLLGDRMLTLVAVFLLLLGSLITVTELIGLLVHWKFGQPATSHTLFLRFSHPRFFNQVQSWLIPLMVLPVLAFKGSRVVAAVALLNLAFWWALLFYSGGRGSPLGLLCAFGFVYLLVFRNERFGYWRNMQIITLVAGVATYLALIFVPQFLGLDSGDAVAGSAGRALAHSSGRISYWQNFLQALAEQPVLGIGPGLSPCFGPVTYFAHPHNFYLQLVVEWGLVAGLSAAGVILFVILSVINKLRAGINKPVPLRAIIVATGVLAAAIHAMFSGVMVMPASQVCGVLVFSYLTALLLNPGQAAIMGNTARYKRTWITILALPVLLAVVQLSYFLLTEIPVLETRANKFVTEHGVHHSPRLWQHGHVCSFPE